MVDPVAVVSAVIADRGRKRGEVVDFVVNYANEPAGHSASRHDCCRACGPSATTSGCSRSTGSCSTTGGDLVFDALRLPGLDGGDRFLDSARPASTTPRSSPPGVTSPTASRRKRRWPQSEALLRGAFDDAPVGALLISVDEFGGRRRPAAEGQSRLCRARRLSAAASCWACRCGRCCTPMTCDRGVADRSAGAPRRADSAAPGRRLERRGCASRAARWRCG